VLLEIGFAPMSFCCLGIVADICLTRHVKHSFVCLVFAFEMLKCMLRGREHVPIKVHGSVREARELGARNTRTGYGLLRFGAAVDDAHILFVSLSFFWGTSTNDEI